MADAFNFTMAGFIFLISNVLFAFIVWRKRSALRKQKVVEPVSSKAVYQLFLILNILGGLTLGAMIAFPVLLSPEPSYFLPALIFAPLGYWVSFGVPMLIVLLAVKIIILKK